MTDLSPKPPLARTAERARAAGLFADASGLPPLCSMVIAEALDGARAGVLRAAGLADDEARAVLAALWSTP